MSNLLGILELIAVRLQVARLSAKIANPGSRSGRGGGSKCLGVWGRVLSLPGPLDVLSNKGLMHRGPIKLVHQQERGNEGGGGSKGISSALDPDYSCNDFKTKVGKINPRSVIDVVKG